MTLRPLTPDDAPAFRALRLRALQEHPEAFGESAEEWAEVPMERVEKRLGGPPGERQVWGLFQGERLVGVVEWSRNERHKNQHRAIIIGMYVAPEARGTGAARALLQAAIQHARAQPGLAELFLGVTVGNPAARRLYRAAGFATYAVVPRQFQIGERFYDLEWMRLPLLPDGEPEPVAPAATLRPLAEADAPAFHALRLRALQEHPEAFAESAEEWAALSLAQVAERLRATPEGRATLGAFEEGALVGVVDVNRFAGQRVRHRAIVGGMYVVPEARGRGQGRALLQAALQHARALDGLEQVILAVTEGNEAARRLYRAAGFVPYAVAPAFLKVGQRRYDIEWLWLSLGSAPEGPH